jgi:predicted DNA-binding protein (MmcQ/YjbR family)
VNLDSLREYCLSFPDATENVQWGADLVFKVGGKMFTVASTDPGDTKFSFKCTPEEFAELIEQDGVKPADYVARYHWVTLLRWDALPDREIRRLVKDSYEMVKAKLPKRTKDTKRTKNTKSAPTAGTASRGARKRAVQSPAPRSRSAARGPVARKRAK